MISFAEAGDPVLLILSVPAEFAASNSDTDCFAIPVMNRAGGFLLCLPRGVISEDVLIDCLSGEDVSHVLGPSKGVPVQLHEEGEDQVAVPVPGSVNVMLVDFSDDALSWIREYDQLVDWTASWPSLKIILLLSLLHLNLCLSPRSGSAVKGQTG